MPLIRLKPILFALGLAVVLAGCNSISNEQGVNKTSGSTAVEARSDNSAFETGAEDETNPLLATETSVETEVPAVGQNENLLASAAPVEIERDPDVPPLPFADNPDPALCGIPQQWGGGKSAYLSGIYEGELIQPIVFLYDSHLRRKIVARAPHGSEVKILLSQSNPELNYFMVKIVGTERPNEGWVPAPFVSFEPPPHL